MEPSQFHTGLVAGLYGDLRGHVYDDPAPWEAFILEAGRPALESGCGDNDPLLALRERGLDAEAVDSSPDMVARRRAAAAERGLTVTVQVAASASHVEQVELAVDRTMFTAAACHAWAGSAPFCASPWRPRIPDRPQARDASASFSMWSVQP